MAISAITYVVTRSLYEGGSLPRNASILEFGEANWLGDMDPQELEGDIDRYIDDPMQKSMLKDVLAKSVLKSDKMWQFDVAKVFYGIFYQYSKLVSIDLFQKATSSTIRHDLNEPFRAEEQFDVTVNNGTAEHVFHAGNVFVSMHGATKPGGLMINEGPLVNGHFNHGFFNFQPTLFFDLAKTNNYQIGFFSYLKEPAFKLLDFKSNDEINLFLESTYCPKDPVFMVVLQKSPEETDFKTPQQGFYYPL